MIIRFQEVTRKRKTKIPCRICKREMTRTISVTHTVNPYHRDESGAPKSYDRVCRDVSEALTVEVCRQKTNGIVCKGCHEEQVANSVPR